MHGRHDGVPPDGFRVLPADLPAPELSHSGPRGVKRDPALSAFGPDMAESDNSFTKITEFRLLNGSQAEPLVQLSEVLTHGLVTPGHGCLSTRET
jgi:hypothetical protein